MVSGSATDHERERVREIADDHSGWRRWGPYLGDRSWATVREDYSCRRRRLGLPAPRPGARSKAYRWGEDGIAGICDRYQLLVLRAGVLERTRPASSRSGSSA